MCLFKRRKSCLGKASTIGLFETSDILNWSWWVPFSKHIFFRAQSVSWPPQGLCALSIWGSAYGALPMGLCPWGSAHGARPMGLCPWGSLPMGHGRLSVGAERLLAEKRSYLSSNGQSHNGVLAARRRLAESAQAARSHTVYRPTRNAGPLVGVLRFQTKTNNSNIGFIPLLITHNTNVVYSDQYLRLIKVLGGICLAGLFYRSKVPPFCKFNWYPFLENTRLLHSRAYTERIKS